MHLSNGTLLQGGKYKIISFINSGGFGCTYEAEHVMLKQRVAIKEFFVKDFCNRDEHTACVTVATQSKKNFIERLRQKFIDEAQSLASFHHEGIVHVSDVFCENGTAYYVMDYIDGQSLSEIVSDKGPLSESKALKYISEVARALRYVHGKNRLHMDIKPGNIMIDSSDHPILIDFGASKHYSEETGENTSTLSGINTPGYAPVEQVNRSNTTFSPCTDLYALGATLYKLLTGITPPNSVSLMSEEEHIIPLSEDISLSTRDAVVKAMQVKRCDRPQNVDEFLNLLEQRTDEETIVSTLDCVGGIQEDSDALLDKKNDKKEINNEAEKNKTSKNWFKSYFTGASKRHLVTNLVLYSMHLVLLFYILLLSKVFLNQFRALTNISLSYFIYSMPFAQLFVAIGLFYCNSLTLKWKKDGLYIMPLFLLLGLLPYYYYKYTAILLLLGIFCMACYFSVLLFKKKGKSTWDLCQTRSKISKLMMIVSFIGLALFITSSINNLQRHLN